MPTACGLGVATSSTPKPTKMGGASWDIVPMTLRLRACIPSIIKQTCCQRGKHSNPSIHQSANGKRTSSFICIHRYVCIYIYMCIYTYIYICVCVCYTYSTYLTTGTAPQVLLQKKRLGNSSGHQRFGVSPVLDNSFAGQL